MNKNSITTAAKHIEIALKELGFYKNSNLEEHLKNTPTRIAKAWSEYSYKDYENLDFEPTSFTAPTINSIQIVKDITFSSLCAHHFFPFMGKCHVAYLPNGKIIGLSKIPRLVNFIASQPNTQEFLVEAIADKLYEIIDPTFVMVIMDNVIHTCCSCRGVKSTTSTFLSSAIRMDPSLSNEDSFSLKEEVIKLLQL